MFTALINESNGIVDFVRYCRTSVLSGSFIMKGIVDPQVADTEGL